MLHLPNFDNEFIMDCDASGSGFNTVLHQGIGPVAFFSRPFAAQHLKAAAYEHGLIGLVQIVRHWQSYLWGRHFVVRTDHFAEIYVGSVPLHDTIPPVGQQTFWL